MGTAPGIANDRPPDGSLRAGDQVLIDVISGGRVRQRRGVVDARGQLHAASERDVAVAGLSLPQAERRIAEAVHTSDKFAEIELHLSPRSPRRMSAFGALTRPGYVTLTPGMRVVDAIAAAGGVQRASASILGGGPLPVPVGDLEEAVLIRNGKALPINVDQALRGQRRHNVYLHAGDQLYVPPATDNGVSVLGQVGAPGIFPHRHGLRLTEALSEAGGITIGGDKDDIRLIRGPVEAPAVYRASLTAIAEGKRRDVRLRSGDVIFVTDHPMEDLGEVMRLVIPFVAIGVSALVVALIVSQ